MYWKFSCHVFVVTNCKHISPRKLVIFICDNFYGELNNCCLVNAMWLIMQFLDVCSRPQSRVALNLDSASQLVANGHVSHHIPAGYDDDCLTSLLARNVP